MAKRTNVTNWPVMAARCPSCPFNADGCKEIRAMVERRCMTEASQICHHPAIKGKKETHLCKGARDFQLLMFYRLGVIAAPTQEAWDKAQEEMRCQRTETQRP